MSTQNFLPHHDDVWFPANYSKADGLLDWLTHRYTTWSGRVAIEAVLPHVLSANVWVWRIINSIFLVILLAAVTYLAQAGTPFKEESRKWIIGLCALCLFLHMKGRILDASVFWATGSMNYLWPAACLCLVLLLFVQLISGSNPRRSFWLYSILPVTYGSYQEQTSLILITFAVIAIAIYRLRHDEWTRWGCAIGFLALLHFCVLIFAPGNELRMAKEIVRFYPDFGALSLTEMILYGLNYTLLNHFFYDFVESILLLLLLTLFLEQRGTKAIAARYFIYFALMYTIGGLLLSKGGGGDFVHLLNYNLDVGQMTGSGTAGPTLHIIPLIFGTSILLAIPMIWISIFRFTPTTIVLCLVYLAGLGSSFILSFSPTIYASGYRIFFIPDVMIITAILILCAESLHHFNSRKRLFIPVYFLLILSIILRTVDIIKS